MRRVYNMLPGPPVLRVAILVAVVIAMLIGLFFLFEWAGDLLDTGGVVRSPG
jgi:hypothetical protein